MIHGGKYRVLWRQSVGLNFLFCFQIGIRKLGFISGLFWLWCVSFLPYMSSCKSGQKDLKSTLQNLSTVDWACSYRSLGF